jgi:nicotinate-nucleotide adenylyltransferase
MYIPMMIKEMIKFYKKQRINHILILGYLLSLLIISFFDFNYNKIKVNEEKGILNDRFIIRKIINEKIKNNDINLYKYIHNFTTKFTNKFDNIIINGINKKKTMKNDIIEADNNIIKKIFVQGNKYIQVTIVFILFNFLQKKTNILFYLLFFYDCCNCIGNGIYGGSFNPIHNGHISLARQMLNSGFLDEVWFVVSPLNPFKKEQSDLLSDELRLEMTKLALEGESNMFAQDFEFRLPKPSFTWQTLKAMSEEYPNRQFVLIIGADNWQAFHLWYNYEEILKTYSLLIYPREGIDINEESLPKNVKLVKAQLYPISSTQVRKNIKEGKSVSDLIPKCIIPLALKYYKGE